ncbi:TIGR02530 family flagellar biosynthesis protein [Paenibacillus taiwanensis]|uniref:TIGR02530 family flagellar biosynthesis protein n=1 Tax=Paenibacillus taiwanensis TaxID=401638 RepID=UPI000408A548|nr:TIGR02530 family flagellar biosynthesis protein [Paenibacillus taiwanensis]
MNLKFPIGRIGTNAPVQPIQQSYRKDNNQALHNGQDVSFKQLLNQELIRSDKLNFSQHASQRIQERGLKMTPELVGKMSDAIEQAAAKGSKQSLLLIQNAAYIVNVPTRTVITALDDPFKQGHVFTAIDSAVCIE